MNKKIKLIGVSKGFKHVPVLNNVNLTVEGSTITGIIGPNGSGKTTLLKLIAGLSYPTNGEIYIDGNKLSRGEVTPSIGIIIGNPTFIETLNGFDNLKYLASIRNEITDEKIIHTLELVGLGLYSKVKIKHYSLGMISRLAIAQAIMEEPEILLLDEPTNALDNDGVVMLKSVLNEYRKNGKSILIVSHDSPFIEEISDQIYRINSHELEKV